MCTVQKEKKAPPYFFWSKSNLIDPKRVGRGVVISSLGTALLGVFQEGEMHKSLHTKEKWKGLEWRGVESAESQGRKG